MRIYIDESGTHEERWLIIGALFVPDHGAVHSALCRVKEERQYFNRSPKHKARYKETHLAGFRSDRDVEVAKAWIEVFCRSSCFFRSIVVDWSIWEGRYFGTPFEAEALKKRRAYKKRAEMLLQPEVGDLVGAILYLDRLRICHGYDVIQHLEDRFTRDYEGANPRIAKFLPADSWADGNQCLQLADLLVGCVYQKLVPSQSPVKSAPVDCLYDALREFGVRERRPQFWRGFASNTLRRHFPKFSEWYWRPVG